MDKIIVKQSLEKQDMYKNLWVIEWKVNELVEGYNEIMKRLERMDKRIAILYHNDNKVEEITEKEWMKKSMDELKRREKEGKL